MSIDAELVRRRRLPHWDMPDAAFFVTTCLQGSIPARGLLDIHGHREELAHRVRPIEIEPAAWVSLQWKRMFVHVVDWLDRRPDITTLADPQLAQAVVDGMYFFAGDRYDLLSFVIMPSHVHWVFQPRRDWVASLQNTIRTRSPRERVVHSVNLFTAAACNRIGRTKGQFWQHESYDHWIRDLDELERIIAYIEGNPVKAGLVKTPHEWRFSSAHDRLQFGIPIGLPLIVPKSK